MLHCENFQDKFSLALTKILEDFIFIINFKIFTNRSFVYKLYGTQFLSKSATWARIMFFKLKKSN